MANIATPIKGRALAQANANTETQTARVISVTKDANGNSASADVRVVGQLETTLSAIPNASGLTLIAGMSVVLNYRRGSRFSPEITGTAGAASGAVIAEATAAADAAAIAAGATDTTADLSGIPILLESEDDTVPDGYIVSPGANILIAPTDPETVSGGDIPGLLTISALVQVRGVLPDPIASGLLDGTLVDLVDSYGNPLGMYRLDRTAAVWRRRDAGSNASKIQGRAVSSTAPANGQALVWSASDQEWEPGTVSGGGGSSITSKASKDVPVPDTLGSMYYVPDDGKGAIIAGTGFGYILLGRTSFSPLSSATTANSWSFLYNSPASTYTDNGDGSITLVSGSTSTLADSSFVGATGAGGLTAKFCFKTKTPSSADYTGASYNRCSIGVRCSGSGNAIALGLNGNAGYQILQFSGNFGGVSVPASASNFYNNPPFSTQTITYWQWRFDSAGMTLEYSFDNKTWTTLYNAANPLGSIPDTPLLMVGNNGTAGTEVASIKVYGVSVLFNFEP